MEGLRTHSTFICFQVGENEKQKSYIAQSRAVFKVNYVVAENDWIASESDLLLRRLRFFSDVFICHPPKFSCPRPHFDFAAFHQVKSLWFFWFLALYSRCRAPVFESIILHAMSFFFFTYRSVSLRSRIYICVTWFGKWNPSYYAD